MLLSPILMLLLAQASGAAQDYPACDQAAADRGVQSALNICAHHEYLAADRKLNAQWRKTAAHMKALDASGYTHDDGRPSYFDALLTSQRAWLSYRDSHCANEGYWARGGSMEPMLVSMCLAALTNDRTEQLRQLAEYPE